VTQSDRVTAKYMPHLGVGVVELAADDRVLVSFEVDGRPYRDDFSPAELEPAVPVEATA
jgi:hypothetical protein